MEHNICSREDCETIRLPEMLKAQCLGTFAIHELDCGRNAVAIINLGVKGRCYYIVNGLKFF